jgi:transcriptional regulator with XRE-family HTH domain
MKMTKQHHIGPEILSAIAIFRPGSGNQLRRRRLQIGLSQLELARLADTKQASISRLESRLKFGPPPLIERIERALKKAAK